jgi:tRNA modification GTPase
LAALDARIALDRLGRVTGESVDDAVLDAIFARFCIGK